MEKFARPLLDPEVVCNTIEAHFWMRTIDNIAASNKLGALGRPASQGLHVWRLHVLFCIFLEKDGDTRACIYLWHQES